MVYECHGWLNVGLGHLPTVLVLQKSGIPGTSDFALLLAVAALPRAVAVREDEVGKQQCQGSDPGNEDNHNEVLSRH